MDWTLISYLCYSQRHVSEPQITAMSSYKPSSPGRSIHVCVYTASYFLTVYSCVAHWLYLVALRDLKGSIAFV